MRTLFLNPNSSEAITNILQHQIAAQGLPLADYDVRQLDGAPRIIGSAADNTLAEALLEERFKTLTSGFQRLVMMSSLDTGFEAAQRLGDIEVHGFTRSVLAQHRRLGQQLQAITFDASMTPLYSALFDSGAHKGVVQSITALPLAPGDVAGAKKAALAALRTLCQQLVQASPSPVFIVGAVGLELGEVLRQEGFGQVINPVADLVAYLQSLD